MTWTANRLHAAACDASSTSQRAALLAVDQTEIAELRAVDQTEIAELRACLRIARIWIPEARTTDERKLVKRIRKALGEEV